MTGKDYVVEYVSSRDGQMTFEVWEHSRPSVRARFNVDTAGIAQIRDASMVMAARIKTALEQVRSR